MGVWKRYAIEQVKETPEGAFFGRIKSIDYCTHLYHYMRIGRLLCELGLLGKYGLAISRKKIDTYIIADSEQRVKAVLEFLKLSALNHQLEIPIN